MLRKKSLIIIGIIAFLSVSMWMLWDYILILDDNHNSFEEYHEINTNPQNEENISPGDSTNNVQDGITSQPDAQKYPVPQKGYHIHINLDEKIMYVYKDSQLLKSYPVSGGKSRTPTPLGTWRIISKDTWGEGFGGAWLGFNVPYGKYGIHGTVYPWLIGKSNSSKGCIRMLNKDAKELYRIVPNGSTVTIVQSNKTFRNMKSGDIGSDVTEIQKSLAKLGYYRGGTDGKFGAALKASVKKFQKDHRLYSSGVVNRATYDLILQKLKEKGI